MYLGLARWWWWCCPRAAGQSSVRLVRVTSLLDTRAVETWRDERVGSRRVVRGVSMQLDNPVIYHVKLHWY